MNKEITQKQGPLNRVSIVRFAAKAGRFIILFFLVVILGGLLVSRTARFQNFLKTSLQKSVSSSLNGDITWKSLRISSLSSVEISGLALTTKNGESVIAIDHAQGRISLLSLLQSHVVLTKVFLHNSTVMFNQRTRPNFVDVFTPKTQPVSKTTAPIWTFAIRKFLIDSLYAYYLDSAGHSTNLVCAAISGRLSAATDFTMDVLGSSLRLTIPDHALTLDSLYFSMLSGVRGFRCDSVAMKSAHMTAYGSFTIPTGNLGPVQANLVVNADNSFLKGINAHAWGVDGCDALTCSANVQGPMEHPTLNANAELTKVIFQNIAMAHLKIQLTCDSSGRVGGRVSLIDQALSGAFSLSTRAYNLLSKPVFDAYHVEGEIMIPDIRELNRVMVKIKTPDFVRKGNARLAITASGASFKKMPDLAHCDLRLTDIAFSNGKSLPAAMLQADIVHDIGALKGEWPEVFSIKADGSLVHDGGSGTGTFTIIDARPLTELLFNKEISGAINGGFSLSNFLSNPSAKVNALGNALTWERLVVNNLKADFAYDNKTGITINAGSADVRGPMAAALENIGKPGIRGSITASLTAQGPALYPNATAHITIDSLIAGMPVADLITTTITLHDGMVVFDDLKIAKGLAVISGSGSFDRSRKNLGAELSISSGVKGSTSGTLAIKGRISDGSISNGICTATNVPVDVARAWFPSMTLPSGRFSMQMSMNGKFSDPSAAAAFQLSDIAFIETGMKPTINGKAVLADHQALAVCTLSVGDSCGPLTIIARAALLPSLRLDTMASLPLEIKVFGSNVCLKPYAQAFSKNIVLDGSLNADGVVSFRRGLWNPEGVLSIISDTFAYPAFNLTIENISLHMKPQDIASNTGIRPIIVSLHTGKVRYRDISFPKAAVQASFKGNSLVIDTANIFFEKGKLSIAGNVPLVPIPELLTHHGIYLALDADSIAAINCNPFINGGRFTSGSINGHITLSPGPANIFPEGALTAEGIVFAVDDVAPSIGPLRFEATIAGDSVLVNGGGLWGAGKIAERGYLTFSNNSLGPSQATLVCNNLKINYLDDTKVTVDSLNAVVSNPLGAWALDGYALLGESNAAYYVPFNQPTAIHAQAPVSKRPSLRLNIQLKIPNSLTMDLKLGNLLSGSASDIRTSLAGTLLITGTVNNPKYAGQVQIDSGTATYLGRLFIIKQGYARLTGGNEINPFIDVVATTNVSQAQTNYGSDSIVVTLHVSGNLKNPAITMTSNKGFSQIEIVSLLTFGSTSVSLAGAGTNVPGSIISNSFSTIVSRQAEKTLGLEQVRFQGNLFTAGSSQANSSVSLSKKISPNVTVTYSRGIADTISQQGVISWKLRPFLFLEFESNERGNTGIDLKYRIKK